MKKNLFKTLLLIVFIFTNPAFAQVANKEVKLEETSKSYTAPMRILSRGNYKTSSVKSRYFAQNSKKHNF